MNAIGKDFLPSRSPLLLTGTAFAVGIASQRWLSMPPAVALLLLAVGFLYALYGRVRPKRSETHDLLLLLGLFALMGAIRYGAWHEAHFNQAFLSRLPLSFDRLSLTIESVQESRRTRVIGRMDSLAVGNHRAALDGTVLINLPEALADSLTPGCRIWIFDDMLEPLPTPRNPGQFNYGNYLHDRGITAVCRAYRPAQVRLSRQKTAFSPENVLFYPLRKQLARHIETHFSEVIGGMLKALLLGLRGDLDQDIREDFQKAGVVHVLAISGLHVGFVALFAQCLLALLALYFKLRNGLVVLVLLFYMLLTGSHPPVVRATVMAVVYLLAINIERRGPILNYLFAAALFILLLNPAQLFWIGFQFSFLTVLAIIYFFPLLLRLFKPLLDRIDRPGNQERLKRWVITPLCVTLAAQIGAAPLTLYYFKQFSLISFVINPLVIPAIGLAVMGGFVFLGSGLLHAAAAGTIAGLLGPYLDGMVAVIAAVADIPGAYIQTTHFSIVDLLTLAGGMLLIFHFSHARIRTLGGAVFLALLELGRCTSLEAPALDLIMLDVGQGDATLMRTPQRRVILIDTGPAGNDWSSADIAILPALQHLGSDRIHKVFITHRHADHYGGLLALLRQCRVDSVYLPTLPLTLSQDDTLRRALTAAGVPDRTLRMGDILNLDSETRIYTLGPHPNLTHYDPSSGQSVNNSSLMLLIGHREARMLFTGDAEAAAESLLNQWGTLLKSDVLQVGHHGSSTSSTPGFLSRVRPEIAVISAGKFNHFGHPDPHVLRRLAAIRAQVFRTDRQQAVWLRYRDHTWHAVFWK